MKVLSLFSGIGLHDLGLTLAGMKIVGQCEIDPFALAVLAKYWPDVYRWKDVRDVNRESILKHCGPIDLITGGFCCQQISVAGKGEGIGTEENPTEKSGLVWELLRIIRAVRPGWLILENVPRLRTLGADTILGELEEAGYTCWPLVVGAEHVGAPHRRHRVWIVGKLDDAKVCGLGSGSRLREHSESRGRRESVGAGKDGELANACGLESQRRGISGIVDGSTGEVERNSEQWERLRDTVIHSGTYAAISELANAVNGGQRGMQRRPEVDGSNSERENADLGPAITELRSDSSVALAGGEGLAGRRELPIGTESQESVFASSSSYLWPRGQGIEQYDWEPPRLVKFKVRRQSTGRLRRLVRDADDSTLEALSRDEAYQEVLEKWANEQALRCYGNANPPHAIELIGKAILNIAKGQHAV